MKEAEKNKESFFKGSKSIILASRPSDRSGLRKFLVGLGASNLNIETCSRIDEGLEMLSKKPFNVLVLDYETDDFGGTEDIIKNFSQGSADENKSLIVVISTSNHKLEIAGLKEKSNVIYVAKPYTVGSINACFENYFRDRIKAKEDLLKKEKIKKQQVKQAKIAFKAFENYTAQHTENDPNDSYSQKCSMFLQNLANEDVDFKLLSEILDDGIALKRYKDMDTFIQGWVQALPIEPAQIPDISKVILYNGRFSLFDLLNKNDPKANLAIGVGMVIAASVMSVHNPGNKLVIDYVQRGLELSQYKPIVFIKGIGTLISVNALDKARELFKSFMSRDGLEISEEHQSQLNNFKELLAG